MTPRWLFKGMADYWVCRMSLILNINFQAVFPFSKLFLFEGLGGLNLWSVFAGPLRGRRVGISMGKTMFNRNGHF